MSVIMIWSEIQDPNSDLILGQIGLHHILRIAIKTTQEPNDRWVIWFLVDYGWFWLLKVLVRLVYYHSFGPI